MRHCTVVTYNVHEWRGTDRRRDFQRVVDVLHEIDADVMGLQEVTFESPSAPDTLDELDHAFPGFSVIRGVTLMRRGSHFGNVLITRYPVVRIDRHDISVPGREPRGVLDASLDLEGVHLHTIVTHLGRRMRERTHQARACTDLLRYTSHAAAVALTDFNEWIPFGPSLRIFRHRMAQTRFCPTFPSRAPFLPLDRIWTSKAVDIRSLHTHRSRKARRASDHLPLVADITVR